MDSVSKYIAHINQHYRLLRLEEIYKIAFRFKIKHDEAITAMLAAGWQEELIGDTTQSRYWAPYIEDKNSMLNLSNFKKIRTAKDFIDLKRPEDDD